jgi:signal transduction histidine kinase
MLKKKYTIIFITALILLITYLHYTTGAKISTLHNIYRELYYLPVLLGALAYGLRGAAFSYLLIFILYLPYVLMNWTGDLLVDMNRFLPLLIQGLFAFTAGYLVDRNRKHEEQLERDRYLAGIGRVATVIVHDLKNPLIAIMAFAKRIKEGKGRVEVAMDQIIDSADHMQKIVNSALDFAKPIRLELKEVDVRHIIKHAVDSCRMKAEQRGVLLSINLPVLAILKSVDSCHLERALVNLISNAIESSEKEQYVSIDLMTQKEILVISIADSGSGMDKKTIDNIFAPFYTRKSGGTGLGMTIAKKIIEGHKGEIHVTSKPRHGTHVTIELPFVYQPARDMERKDSQ